MKGLLLKDFYMTMKYCRMTLLFAAVFIFVSVVNDDNFFLSFYPCILSGMIPVTLLGYDERSRWSHYCGILPYTKTQIVSAKYLMGLFAQIVVIALSALAQAVRMNLNQTFDMKSYITFMALLLILSCFSASICLPFMFKLGVEKGRIAYYFMIGMVCGASAAASNLLKNMKTIQFSTDRLLPFLFIVIVTVYVLSWYLSIVFYKRREV